MSALFKLFVRQVKRYVERALRLLNVSYKLLVVHTFEIPFSNREFRHLAVYSALRNVFFFLLFLVQKFSFSPHELDALTFHCIRLQF